MATACNSPVGQGGGQAGSGLQRPVVPPGMTAAQAAAYCSQLARTYDIYVGSIGAGLGGFANTSAPADIDTKVAIASCQDGNYAAGRQLCRRHSGAAAEAARCPRDRAAAAVGLIVCAKSKRPGRSARASLYSSLLF
jgi:hypothetical protein